MPKIDVAALPSVTGTTYPAPFETPRASRPVYATAIICGLPGRIPSR